MGHRPVIRPARVGEQVRPQDGGFYMLKIDQNGASISPAGDLVGKGMYEVDKVLWEEHGKVAVIGIGQTGEMKMSMAGISVNDMEKYKCAKPCD